MAALKALQACDGPADADVVRQMEIVVNDSLLSAARSTKYCLNATAYFSTLARIKGGTYVPDEGTRPVVVDAWARFSICFSIFFSPIHLP
jgi:hypothetical protein